MPKPSADGTTCKYRSTNGERCVIGALIDDSHYSPDLEGLVVDEPLVKDAVKKSLNIDIMSATLSSLLFECQNVHDKRFNQRRFMLETLAGDYGLKMPAA